MKAFRTWVRILLLVLNLLSALLLVGCAASSYVSPASLPFFSVFNMAFPLLVILNLAWPFVWMFRHRGYVFVSITALAISSINIFNYCSVFPATQSLPHDSKLKLMSFNVRNFDLYNWNNNQRSKKSIIDFIVKENPDVLCLQEFYTDETEKFNTLKELKKYYPYFHFRKSLVLEKSKYWGQATFSKYPIKNRELLRFANSKHNMALVTDIEVMGKGISVYNLHLQSFQFNYRDYETVEHIDADSLGSDIPFRRWYRMLRNGNVKRASQAEQIAAHISKNAGAAVVCGDFNDTPNSYAYYTISRGLQDCFQKTSWGFGRTYNGSFPSLRIDYVLVSAPLKPAAYKVHYEQKNSDHFPLSAGITW
ncbi:MAG: endonuclease/exonuclease/phosphatase family protein [Chitinophagales bacterium]|nr:endonuclease/exonuclease/phosphatase family protein [Chitinophagales bacterium]